MRSGVQAGVLSLTGWEMMGETTQTSLLPHPAFLPEGLSGPQCQNLGAPSQTEPGLAGTQNTELRDLPACSLQSPGHTRAAATYKEGSSVQKQSSRRGSLVMAGLRGHLLQEGLLQSLPLQAA